MCFCVCTCVWTVNVWTSARVMYTRPQSVFTIWYSTRILIKNTMFSNDKRAARPSSCLMYSNTRGTHTRVSRAGLLARAFSARSLCAVPPVPSRSVCVYALCGAPSWCVLRLCAVLLWVTAFSERVREHYVYFCCVCACVLSSRSAEASIFDRTVWLV